MMGAYRDQLDGFAADSHDVTEQVVCLRANGIESTSKVTVELEASKNRAAGHVPPTIELMVCEWFAGPFAQERTGKETESRTGALPREMAHVYRTFGTILSP
jgi:hypothetical protein